MVRSAPRGGTCFDSHANNATPPIAVTTPIDPAQAIQLDESVTGSFRFRSAVGRSSDGGSQGGKALAELHTDAGPQAGERPGRTAIGSVDLILEAGERVVHGWVVVQELGRAEIGSAGGTGRRIATGS